MTTHNRPFLLAEDLSAIGTMSLGAAIPIMSAMDVPTAILPTQVLSTQTEGFGEPVSQASVDWVSATLAHWQAQSVQLSGGLIGYIGREDLVRTLATALTTQRLPLLIVDPVMADDGALYPGLASTYVAAIRRLMALATVVTPNWTEAQLLTGQTVTGQPTETQIQQQMNGLQSLTAPGTQLVITGIPGTNQVKTACWDGQLTVMTLPNQDGHFYGSGDVFSAILSGALVHHWSLTDAVTLAVNGIKQSLDQTSEVGYQRRFGMQLSRLLQWLGPQMSQQDK